MLIYHNAMHNVYRNIVPIIYSYRKDGTMFNWYVFVLIIFVVILLTTCIVFLFRKDQKSSTSTKAPIISSSNLNTKLEDTGFYYSLKDDIFCSQKNAWQRNFGYCHLYDEAMPHVGIIVDCEPIYFDYDNKHWLIEFRKGQYGMACGGEVCIYNTPNGPMKAPGFHGTFYESISEDECLPISFVLKKNKKVLIRRKAIHWWLTGLKLAEFSNTGALSLTIKIVFPNKIMSNAFVSGLIHTGYTNREFSKHFRTVCIHFTKPHTIQPASRTRIQETIVQQGNEKNCNLYHQLTSDYKNTVDKLEFLSHSSPDLYHNFLKSFHSKELYTSFELIRPILKKFPLVNQAIKIDEPFTDSIDI